MALRFGTSGLRGLVTEMTDRECYLYTRSFIRYVKARTTPGDVALAGDLRSSTPRILRAVAHAAREEGIEVQDCGLVPTPALTLYGLQRQIPSIMVTGSHIPEDRNGIKFNMPWGEVLKADEKEISDRYPALREEEDLRARKGSSVFTAEGELKPEAAPGIVSPPEDTRARQEYIDRYVSFFPASSLQGMRIVFYQHSSVSRKILPEILRRLGADVVEVGWSDCFLAVDTEAVEDTEQLARWVAEHGAHGLVSTDGDGDRPLVVDERGKVVRGDVLGILVADFLRADSVSVPVSCNTALEKSGRFKHVDRTRIGSPFVIESMLRAVRAGYQRVVGYEANGGFLTGTDIHVEDATGTLKALPTRDAALPILAVLVQSLRQDRSLSELVSSLPPRYTQSGLIRGVPMEKGTAFVERFRDRAEEMVSRVFGSSFGPIASLDFTDGARITFAGGDMVHLRPSGNAPEFRCYTESDSEERALEINRLALDKVRAALG